MRKTISITVFIVLLILTSYTAFRVYQEYLPTIQFILNPEHKPTKIEEEMLLKARRNPSPSDFNELYKYALDNSTDTPYIEIGKCSPYPRIVHITKYDFITFKNSDKEIHVLEFTPKEKYHILPKSELTIPLNFYKHTPSVYGYKCDNLKDAVGILFVKKSYSDLDLDN